MKWTAALLLVLVACGPGGRQTPGDDDTSGGDDDGGGGGGGGGGGSGCSDAAKLIYVVDENNNLAQFNAGSKTFTQLGVLSCPAGDNPTNGEPANPFSMAVDRDAEAYVLYEDNAIYKVDTTQSGLPCTPTGWTTSSSSTLQEFGMGYSTDTPGSDTDTLFIAGGQDLDSNNPPTTSTLATLDTTAWTAQEITSSLSGSPELTGNANAELWGFFPDVSGDGSMIPLVTQIDKTSGNYVTANKYQEPSLDNGQPSAWAFGFYGGDYWVFLAFYNELGESDPSSVYQIAGPSSMSGNPGQIVSTTPAQVNGTPLIIVGAGVSTCAPIVIQ